MDPGSRAGAVTWALRRRSRRRGAACALILGLLVAARAAAAADAAAEPSPMPVWYVGPYFGAGVHSPGGGDWGGVPDRDHVFLGVRGTAPVARWRALTMCYAAELVPLLVVTNNPEYRLGLGRVGGVVQVVEFPDGDTSPVLGVGVSPLGLETHVRLRPRAQAFGEIGMGVVWFTRDVPVANSRSVNLTAEMGLGLLWEYRERRRLRFGYKFHHLSNSWTADENPGLNANVFYVGWEVALGKGSS